MLFLIIFLTGLSFEYEIPNFNACVNVLILTSIYNSIGMINVNRESIQCFGKVTYWILASLQIVYKKNPTID